LFNGTAVSIYPNGVREFTTNILRYFLKEWNGQLKIAGPQYIETGARGTAKYHITQDFTR